MQIRSDDKKSSEYTMECLRNNGSLDPVLELTILRARSCGENRARMANMHSTNSSIRVGLVQSWLNATPAWIVYSNRAFHASFNKNNAIERISSRRDVRSQEWVRCAE